MLDRRQFIKAGLAGSLLLAGAAWWAAPEAEPAGPAVSALRCLRAGDAVMIGAVAPIMLGLPDVAIAQLVQGVDRAVQALPDAVRRELRQLFDLLGNAWGRRWLAGVRTPWAHAGAQEIDAFLRSWQGSRFTLLRSGYQGLHALIMAAWYGNPRSWDALGYAQPAQVMEMLP